MTNILFVIVEIFRNQFKCNYLRKKKSFVNLFWIYEIYFKSWAFKKKIALIAYVFSKLKIPKDVVS